MYIEIITLLTTLIYRMRVTSFWKYRYGSKMYNINDTFWNLKPKSLNDYSHCRPPTGCDVRCGKFKESGLTLIALKEPRLQIYIIEKKIKFFFNFSKFQIHRSPSSEGVRGTDFYRIIVITRTLHTQFRICEIWRGYHILVLWQVIPFRPFWKFPLYLQAILL